jgi:hypothetical protein
LGLRNTHSPRIQPIRHGGGGSGSNATIGARMWMQAILDLWYGEGVRVLPGEVGK